MRLSFYKADYDSDETKGETENLRKQILSVGVSANASTTRVLTQAKQKGNFIETWLSSQSESAVGTLF